MSNELIQAADDARRLLRGFQAFSEVAAALDMVGALEQRKTEGESILASLTAEIVAARTELNTHIEQIEQVRAEAKSTTADAKTAADGIVKSANLKAEDIISDANAAAAETRVAAENVRAQADAHITSLTTTRDSILAETTALEERATAAREYLASLVNGA